MQVVHRRLQSLLDTHKTKQNKRKKQKQKQKQNKKQNSCRNTGERILSTSPARKHWPQHMDSGLAHLKNDIFSELIQQFFAFPGYDFETQRIWNNSIILKHHCL